MVWAPILPTPEAPKRRLLHQRRQGLLEPEIFVTSDRGLGLGLRVKG